MGGAGLQFAFCVFHHQRVALVAMSVSMEDAVRLKEFIHGASKLPVLPQVTMRLLKALDSPDGSAREIARICEAEPALTARLLKLANSSFYGQSGNIAKVDRAVAVLGAKTIRSLALTVWTQTLRSHGRTREEKALLSPLLAHGLASGIVARLLAARLRPALGEDAFMAGLLHDIGRVALVAQLGAKYQTLILDPALREGVALHEKEAAVLGFDHRGLGTALMQSWALPRFLGTVAEMHHDIPASPGDSLLISAVALADDFATRLRFNLALDAPRANREQLALFFGFRDPREITEFLEICMQWFGTMSEVLNKVE